MKATKILVGDKIDGWHVTEVKVVSYAEGVLGMPNTVVLLKLEGRRMLADGSYITDGVPRINWYSGDESVEVERND
jgi:hypothetical protein